MLFSNEAELGEILFEVLPPYYLFLEAGIPLLLLLVVMIRGIDKRLK